MKVLAQEYDEDPRTASTMILLNPLVRSVFQVVPRRTNALLLESREAGHGHALRGTVQTNPTFTVTSREIVLHGAYTPEDWDLLPGWGPLRCYGADAGDAGG